MLPPYLTDDEIAGMTKPLTQGAARIKYIRDVLKVPVERRPDGQPIVRRADYEGRAVAPAANDSAGNAERDWSRFDEKVRYGRGAKEKRRQSARA